MIYKNEEELFSTGVFDITDGKVSIVDVETFRQRVIDNLADTVILSNSIEFKKFCHWVINEAAVQLGVVPASIQPFYEARAKDGMGNFTVPALNIRTLTYDLARAVFRSAEKINAGAFIFEIAQSEIGYTHQRPREYTSCIFLAAMKEGFIGPIFLQGDHFQLDANNFFADKEKEISRVKEIIKEGIEAGFYNIDIDSSTLVDLSKESVDEQQKDNYQVCSILTDYVRDLQPKGIEISIGGEIGEVGKKNSTPQELHAFMAGYNKNKKSEKGISKISIQTGTFHGGIVLPDGSIAKVNIDFDTLKELSQISKKEYGMAGAVQHGASTLPNDAFHGFTEAGCAEIHLATQFQNIIYDYLPLSLKEKIYSWLHDNRSDERQIDQTNDQFIYKTRKKALGPFKREMYSLPRELKNRISAVLEDEFSLLFEKLNIKNTKDLINQYVPEVKVIKEKMDFLKVDNAYQNLEEDD